MKPRLVLPVLSAVFLLAGSAGAKQPDAGTDLKDAGITSRNCATPEPGVEEMRQVARTMARRAQEFGALAVGGQIQVAFHVIYNGSTGNIPQSQIDAQIAELNKAFSGFYGGANTGYTFVLASVDRTNNRKWFRMTPGSGAETQAKNALAIDPARRLNIYTCQPGQNLLGWAVFPWSYPENSKQHGVVIHYGSVPGGYLAPFNLGGTADHEVGHYLGLYHTFQGGCSEPNDQVADTPQGQSTSGCPEGKDTCPAAGLDPIHNYMDYSDDACYTEFTAGQDARMDAIVPQYRPSLLNAAIAQSVAERDAAIATLTPVVEGGALEFRGAFPNPSDGATSLFFYLPKATHVTLKVYDVAGRVVSTLVDGAREAGVQSVEFRAPKTGMYFARIEADGVRMHRRLIVVE